jgi:hypothetical protein
MDSRVSKTITAKIIKYSKLAWAKLLFFLLNNFLKVMIKSPNKKTENLISAFGSPANVLAFDPEAKQE